MVARFRPGDVIKVSYIRKSKNLETNVVLQENMIRPIHPLLLELGFELRDLTESEKKNYERNGARVNSIYKDSKIMGTNMDLDFVITSVNGTEVTSVEDVLNIIKNGNGRVELGGFYPQFDGEYFYSFEK
jgi:S1-C subfamily serine protease